MNPKFTEEPAVIDEPAPVEALEPTVEAITFDTGANLIIVMRSGAPNQVYGPEDAAKYIKEHERPEDVAAMGWDEDGVA